MGRACCARRERQSRLSFFSLRRPAGPASSPSLPRFLSRLPRAAARLALAALLLAGAGTVAAPASAATLVSNLSQGSDDDHSTSRDRAQRFTTGSNTRGYVLTDVRVESEDAEGDSFSVSVCTVDANNRPTSTCTDLAAPESFAAGELTFTAPSNTVLAADTTYALLIESNGTVDLVTTTSNSESSGKFVGWNIANELDYKNSSDTWETHGSESVRISVRGTATPPSGAVWSATLKARNLINVARGCSNSVGAGRCRASSVLSDDDFTLSGTTYAITVLFVRNSNKALELDFDTDLETAAEGLTLDVDGTGFDFADADTKGARSRHWNSSGLAWSTGNTVPVALIDPGSVNTPPTASNGTVETQEDRDYTFAHGDFNFSDTDSGDTELASVKIVSVETAGDLELDGTDVAANQVVTKTQLDDNQLVFEPADDAHGSPYATFTFKVNDGEDDSDDTYTMTIDVDPTPDVTDISVTSTPTSGTTPKKYGEGEKIQFTATFDEAVTVIGHPDLEFQMADSGDTQVTKDAAYARGSGSTKLVFEYTVQSSDSDDNGIKVNANPIDLDSASNDGIVDSDGNGADNRYAALGTLSGHKIDGSLTPPEVDTTAPSLESATVNGTSLVITFNENLAAASNLTNDAFTVKVAPSGGSAAEVALSGSPSISGKTVMLSLAAAVRYGDTVTVSYGKPVTDDNNRLEDGDDNEVVSFDDQSVTNTTPPELELSETRVTLDEDGTATYLMRLKTEPLADVTVNIESGDDGAASVAPATLGFGTHDWDDWKPVTVTGVQDGDQDDETVTIAHTIGGGQVGAVIATVEDDDLPRLVFSDDRVDVPEGGEQTYEVELDQEPRTTVTVRIANSDTGEATVAPSMLTFTAGDWGTAQEVTVTGLADPDGKSERLTLTHSGSGVRTRTLTAWVIDDEAVAPQPAINLQVTQWHATDGASLAWDLPAQHAEVTVEYWRLQKYDSDFGLWGDSIIRTKAFDSYDWSTSGGSTLNEGDRVRVVLTSVEDLSAESAELTIPAAPEGATNLRVDGKAGLTSIPLAWDLPATQPSGVTVSAVVVERRLAGSTSWKVARRLAADATSLTASDLTPATDYRFRVVLETSRGRVVSERLEISTVSDKPPVGSVVIAVPGNVTFAGALAALVGDTLTADTSGISDANGLTNPNWRFQWIRKDTDRDSLAESYVTLAGATGRTYTARAADALDASFIRLVRVRATYTDDDGFTRTIESKDSFLEADDGAVYVHRLARDTTVLAVEDEDRTFTPHNFGYTAIGETDKLAKVRIVSVETAGDLEFDGADVTAGLEMTFAELDDDKLVFKVPADVHGDRYATFTYKVSSATLGADRFGPTRTMTIDVHSVPDVTDVSITSVPRSGTGTPKKYGEGETIQVTVTFDEAVEVTGDPHVDVQVGSNERDAAYESGSGSKVLVFEYEVVAADRDSDGISIAANDLKLDSNDKIRNDDPGLDPEDRDADVTHAALAAQSDHKVDGSLSDTTAPSALSASVGRTTVTIAFDEPLDSSSAPAVGAFSVKRTRSGSEGSVTRPARSPRTTKRPSTG